MKEDLSVETWFLRLEIKFQQTTNKVKNKVWFIILHLNVARTMCLSIIFQPCNILKYRRNSLLFSDVKSPLKFIGEIYC